MYRSHGGGHGTDLVSRDRIMQRYAVITTKNPREIVLLRGRGCAWKQCTFCDYHHDASPDAKANFLLNASVLENVTGSLGRLEVINSGSFTDLDPKTVGRIEDICRERGISHLYCESHWLHRKSLASLRRRFAALGVTLKIKTGVETFDAAFREERLRKGMGKASPEEIAAFFDECCLLFGLAGQTFGSMTADIATGLEHFERVCVNVMQPNSTNVTPDAACLAVVEREIFPAYKDEPRIDFLLRNTDFGVGG